ncbi:MAG: hypothetical protein WD558_06085, partial [Pseudomonadales bacterium]
AGGWVRPCYFEPTFHKHVFKLCQGFQFHTDMASYDHERFKPFRLVAGLLKSLRTVDPGYSLWRHHDYEYEPDRTPIDVINGGERLRLWVDDATADFNDLESRLQSELSWWLQEREPYLMYE